MGGQGAATWAELCRLCLQGQLVTPSLEEVHKGWANLFYQFPIKWWAELTFSGSRSEGVWLAVRWAMCFNTAAEQASGCLTTQPFFPCARKPTCTIASIQFQNKLRTGCPHHTQGRKPQPHLFLIWWFHTTLHPSSLAVHNPHLNSVFIWPHKSLLASRALPSEIS